MKCDRFRSSLSLAKAILFAISAVLAVYLAGCDDVMAAPSQPLLDPDRFIDNEVTQTQESRVETKTETGTPQPMAAKNTLPAPDVSATKTLTLEQLSTALEIRDLNVTLRFEKLLDDEPGPACSFSSDNLFTCAVPESGYRAVRISFVVDPNEKLTLQDRRRVLSHAVMVIYPYKTVSRYNVQPPVCKAEIINDNDGAYHADFKLNNPYAAFSFYLLVDGTSIAGSNLYLN